MRHNRFLALTGVLFIALIFAGFGIGGEPPDPTEEPVREIVEFYVDNDTEQWISLGFLAVGVTLFLIFTSYLRTVLRAAEPDGGGTFSPLLLVGAGIFATGAAIDGTITIALVETVEDIEPDAIQALAALWHNDFVPIALGAFVWVLSLAISVLKHGGLPKWIGWLALLLAVISITPIGFVAFPGTGLLILILSILLFIRAGKADSTPPPAAPPAAPAV